MFLRQTWTRRNGRMGEGIALQALGEVAMRQDELNDVQV